MLFFLMDVSDAELVTRFFFSGAVCFCRLVLSHLPLQTGDMRSRICSIAVTEPLFLDGKTFCWFCTNNLVFVSVFVSGAFGEVEHEGRCCDIPAPFCRA